MRIYCSRYSSLQLLYQPTGTSASLKFRLRSKFRILSTATINTAVVCTQMLTSTECTKDRAVEIEPRLK